MNIAIWVLSVILGLLFTFSGSSKLIQGRAKFTQRMGPNARWTGYVTDTQFLIIGLVEVLGGLGLILPRITGIAVLISVVAAVGLALAMFAGVALHVVIGDKPEKMVPASLLGSLCLILLLFQTL